MSVFDVGTPSESIQTTRNVATTFGMEKTRMIWLLDIEKSLTDVFSRFDTIMACDGGRTDGQKYCDSIVRAI